MDTLPELAGPELDAALSEPAGGRTLVEFYGDRCPACRMVATVLESLRDEPGFTARVLKLNVDTYPDIARRLGIRGVPTLVLFEGATEQRRMPGSPSRAAIRAFVAGAAA